MRPRSGCQSSASAAAAASTPAARPESPVMCSSSWAGVTLRHPPGRSGRRAYPAAAASRRRSPAGRPHNHRGQEMARTGAGYAHQADVRTSGACSAEDDHGVSAMTQLLNQPAQPPADQNRPGGWPTPPPGPLARLRPPRHAHPPSEREAPHYPRSRNTQPPGAAACLASWWDRANGGRHTRRCREAGSAGIREDEADGAIGISAPVPGRVRRAALG